MEIGDEFELSTHKCGNFCGLFYHHIAGWVKTLQFGGSVPFFPDPDTQVWECPNSSNKVRVELKRIKQHLDKVPSVSFQTLLAHAQILHKGRNSCRNQIGTHITNPIPAMVVDSRGQG